MTANENRISIDRIEHNTSIMVKVNRIDKEQLNNGSEIVNCQNYFLIILINI